MNNAGFAVYQRATNNESRLEQQGIVDKNNRLKGSFHKLTPNQRYDYLQHYYGVKPNRIQQQEPQPVLTTGILLTAQPLKRAKPQFTSDRMKKIAKNVKKTQWQMPPNSWRRAVSVPAQPQIVEKQQEIKKQRQTLHVESDIAFDDDEDGVELENDIIVIDGEHDVESDDFVDDDEDDEESDIIVIDDEDDVESDIIVIDDEDNVESNVSVVDEQVGRNKFGYHYYEPHGYYSKHMPPKSVRKVEKEPGKENVREEQPCNKRCCM